MGFCFTFILRINKGSTERRYPFSNIVPGAEHKIKETENMNQIPNFVFKLEIKFLPRFYHVALPSVK